MLHMGILRIRKSLVSAGAASEDVDTDPVPRGEVWHITHFAVEDLDTAMTDFRVGIARAGSFSPLVEQDAPAAATLFWTHWEYWLGEGETLRLRVTGATSADHIDFWVNGERLVEEHQSSHLTPEPELALVEG